MQQVESNATVNGVDIAYQIVGASHSPTLLLIHGLSTPLTGWPTKMVHAFVEQGYRVLLVDNRDIGKSQLCDHLGVPNLLWIMLKKKFGFRTKPPYFLDDMKNDIVALLRHLSIDHVHVIGASMGGMIAQLLAIYHPELVQSLTSIMSTTGDKSLPKMDKKVAKELAKTPKSKAMEDRVQYHINKWKLLAGDIYKETPDELRQYVKSMLDRGITGKGTNRQILAILAADDRTQMLNELKAPTLVLHGAGDMLVKVVCGEETAAAIPQSELKIYPEMGHNFPTQLIPEITQDIIQFVEKQKQSEICNDSV